MAKEFRVNTLILSGQRITLSPTDSSGFLRHDGTFANIPTGSYVTNSQTGSLVDVTSNLGTGSGIFSSKSNSTVQLKSLSAGSGINISGDSNGLAINTFLGNQLIATMQNNFVMVSGSTYYNLVSGNVGPGTWLTIAQVNFRTTSNASQATRITAELWNGNTGVGIYSAAETSVSTSGQSSSGFAPVDMTAIVNLTAASNTMTLRAASTQGNTHVLAVPSDFATGILSGVSTYIHMVRLL